MKLHLDKDAFRVLIEAIHNKTGYRSDVLEKDYYVVLILRELAEKQAAGLPAFFKGGTALYKALKTTNRFSEDIDLSVDTRECSRTQNDKRLEAATKKYTSLERNLSMGRTNRSEVISVYHYDPLTVYDANDALQRFGLLKIEATSFTISEPTDSMEIAPMLYDLATTEQKTILETEYDVRPFSVMTITMERIFIDKLFAAESYMRKSDNPYHAFEAAKHIYDLSVMEWHPKIIALLSDTQKMKLLLDIRTEEEQKRLDGIPGVSPSEFTFFTDAVRCAAVRAAYEIMQRQYVLRASDRIAFDTACESLTRLLEKLVRNNSWKDYTIRKQSVRAELQKAKVQSENKGKSVLSKTFRDEWER